MLKFSLSLSISLSIFILILVAQPLQITALNSCSGRFCYDDDILINTGDLFSWTYEKTNTGSSNYYHPIDKGLPDDFAQNFDEPSIVQIEIVRDFMGSESYAISSNEISYFDTSISTNGVDFAENVAGRLRETLLIKPTIRNLESGLVNAFEFKQSIAPSDVISSTLHPTHHETYTINRQIEDGIFIEATQLEIYDSAEHTNLRRSSVAVEQIDIRTGIMILYQLELTDFENDADYTVVFEFAQDLPEYVGDLVLPAPGTVAYETVIKLDRSNTVLPLFSILVVLLGATVVVIVVLMKTQKMII